MNLKTTAELYEIIEDLGIQLELAHFLLEQQRQFLQIATEELRRLQLELT